MMEPLLEIIVPHYREPWGTGEKFFTMLRLQRGVDFSLIRVTVVNDGEENALPDECFAGLPYAVRQEAIPHGGVSAARNAGLRQSDAEWIMFCDFDDMFANVYALRDILNVLPAPEYDMLWSPFVSEDMMTDGKIRLHPRGENVVFIHAKLYRRKFLLNNGLWFPEDLEFNEDSAFNAIANTVVDYKRTGQIKTAAPMYVWCYTEGSTTTTPGNRGKALIGLYERNKHVCEAFKRRMPFDRYCAMVARTIWDAYHALNVDELPEIMRPMLEDFRKWYAARKTLFGMVPQDTMKQVEAISRAEHDRGDEEEEARWHVNHAGTFRRDVSITDWLKQIERENHSATERAIEREGTA